MMATVDLERYFGRIGYRGSPRPDVATLSAITRAHTQSIPFENLNPLLRWPVRLEPAALFRKLVVEGRGGYCFEQNGLLLEVLRQLGFTVRPLRAAVRLGQPDRSVPAGHTHLALEVMIDGEPWLTDVGVGGASLTAALRLAPDLEQTTPHDVRRFVRADGKWFHQIQRDGAWGDVYEFGGESMLYPDRVIASWYTSTCPDVKFCRDLSVAIARPDGGRTSLYNHELTLHGADGSKETRLLADSDAVLGALQRHFGIRLPAGTRIPLPPLAMARAG